MKNIITKITTVGFVVIFATFGRKNMSPIPISAIIEMDMRNDSQSIDILLTYSVLDKIEF